MEFEENLLRNLGDCVATGFSKVSNYQKLLTIESNRWPHKIGNVGDFTHEVTEFLHGHASISISRLFTSRARFNYDESPRRYDHNFYDQNFCFFRLFHVHLGRPARCKNNMIRCEK